MRIYIFYKIVTYCRPFLIETASSSLLWSQVKVYPYAMETWNNESTKDLIQIHASSAYIGVSARIEAATPTTQPTLGPIGLGLF